MKTITTIFIFPLFMSCILFAPSFERVVKIIGPLSELEIITNNRDISLEDLLKEVHIYAENRICRADVIDLWKDTEIKHHGWVAGVKNLRPMCSPNHGYLERETRHLIEEANAGKFRVIDEVKEDVPAVEIAKRWYPQRTSSTECMVE